MSDRQLFNVQAFRDWAAKQPGPATYDYHDCHDCAFARYLSAIGLPDAKVTIQTFQPDTYSAPRPMPDGVDNCVFMTPRTFGHLTARLDRLLAEGKFHVSEAEQERIAVADIERNTSMRLDELLAAFVPRETRRVLGGALPRLSRCLMGTA